MKKQTVQASHDLRVSELRRELREAAQELHCAYARFNFVTEPGLIEAGIYDINALKSRYDFLLRKMKSLQGQTLRQPAPQAVSIQPDCVPAGNMKGGQSCPS